MRRSSSSSAIPLRTSRLPVRDSMHSGQNNARSISKPRGQYSLTRNSRTSSNPNLLDIPHTSTQRSGSLVRQTLCTPLSQPRYSRLQPKSPGWSSIKKDNRPITDKHWQFDQLGKVRNFVSRYFGHLELYDVSTIKSGISLDVFLSLINNYMQVLDNQARVMRDNYMEEVPKLLKCYGYPGNVKPSLMKTVNTPHSWPHILAIFSWLSDLISEIDIPEDYAPFSGIHNVIYLHTLDMLKQLQTTKGSEDVTRQRCLNAFDNEIVQDLNLDVKLLENIDDQMERLKSEIVNSETKSNELKTNIQTLQTNIKDLSAKCNTYEQESKTFLTQLEKQKKKYLEKMNTMETEVKAARDEERCCQAVVDAQPYTLTQKEDLLKEVHNLQISKDLREQRRLQQQKHIHEYDSKLTESMQSTKSRAYEYNNIINNLELSNPEFRKLHIRESGFARSDTKEELGATARLLRMAIDEIKKIDQNCILEIEKLTQEKSKLRDSHNQAVKEMEELNKLHAELVLTLEFENKQFDLERRKQDEKTNKAQTELERLKKHCLDITPIENEVKALEKTEAEFEELLQKNKMESLFFFQNIQKQMNQTAVSYMEIMADISHTFTDIVAQNNLLFSGDFQEETELQEM